MTTSRRECPCFFVVVFLQIDLINILSTGSDARLGISIRSLWAEDCSGCNIDHGEINPLISQSNLNAESPHWTGLLTPRRARKEVRKCVYVPALGVFKAGCVGLKVVSSGTKPLSLCTLRAAHLALLLSGQGPLLCESAAQVAHSGSAHSLFFPHHHVQTEYLSVFCICYTNKVFGSVLEQNLSLLHQWIL